MSSELINRNFRINRLPHIWCPGCGNGIIMHALARAIDNLKLNADKVCIVSGIGCSSRATGYMNFDTMHTTHGRALAFATGIKLANPELNVIIITGDGDCSAIGGNHLIHAGRRNIDMTTIVFNNNIYGMTGGQYSPTTPTAAYATTAPFGNIDSSLDICKLADAAGATYIARGTVYHVNQLTGLMENAIKNRGFSLVDAISICPTHYGRKNKKGTPLDMINELNELTIDVKATKNIPQEGWKDKLLLGELKHIIKPEYTDEYSKLVKRATEKGII